jgi:HAD superfamily hydrolase (TIGR01450 family)
MDALGGARGFLVDLDGTLVSGGTVLPGARELLAAMAGRFALVSNDAEHTPAELAAMLRRLDLDIPAERIVLAGAVALDLVALETPGAKVMLLGSAALAAYGREAGLDLDADRPEVVVIGRDRQFSYARIEAAANAVRAGAALIVTNPDRTHPGRDGLIVPETGALASAVLACTGAVDYRIIGKPEPALFLAGLALLGIEPDEALMIGDNPETDGKGARLLGIGYLQVEDSRRPDESQPPGERRARLLHARP